jgi:hypothetical protein
MRLVVVVLLGDPQDMHHHKFGPNRFISPSSKIHVHRHHLHHPLPQQYNVELVKKAFTFS